MVVHDRRLVARVEHRRVDDARVCVGRERARRVAEERDDRERSAAEARAEVRGVEHPDVGASDTGGCELGIDGRILPAVRGGDEGARAARAGEHDVARLVADQQGADDARRVARDVDDAHAVGEMVDDPDLASIAHGNRHWLEANRHRTDPLGRVTVDAKDLERTVGRVRGEEPFPVARKRKRPHRPALERSERSGSAR
jgi:hypothetical protein